MADRALGNPIGNPLGVFKSGVGVLSSPNDPKIFDFTSSGPGEFVVPDGFKFARITVVGGGGGGRLDNGGGGGGLSRSGSVHVSRGEVIKFVVGAGGLGSLNTPTNGGSTTATLRDIALIATGGMAGSDSGVAPGGTGSGGDDNYRGGSGYRGGGGAAGWDADGGNGSSSSSPPAVLGRTSGGGGATDTASNRTGGGGGGGVGASGGPWISSGKIGAAPSVFGSSGSPALGFAAGAGGMVGGGGGGGGYVNSTTNYPGANGGVGGVRIELW